MEDKQADNLSVTTEHTIEVALNRCRGLASASQEREIKTEELENLSFLIMKCRTVYHHKPESKTAELVSVPKRYEIRYKHSPHGIDRTILEDLGKAEADLAARDAQLITLITEKTQHEKCDEAYIAAKRKIASLQSQLETARKLLNDVKEYVPVYERVEGFGDRYLRSEIDRVLAA